MRPTGRGMCVAGCVYVGGSGKWGQVTAAFEFGWQTFFWRVGSGEREVEKSCDDCCFLFVFGTLFVLGWDLISLIFFI